MELVKLGKVVKLHGYLGAMKVSTAFDKDFDIKKIDRIFDENQNEYDTKRVFENTGAIVIEAAGIDLEKAKTFVGKDIFIDRTLVEGKILFEDLKGSEVILDDKSVLGKVVDVQDYGAAEVIYVLTENGKEIMFPNAAGVILSFDYKAKKLVVDSNRLKEVSEL